MNKAIELLIKYLSETALFEMVYKRKEMFWKIEGIGETLFQHWCLARYCVLYDFGNKNKNHWIHEVKNFIYSIQKLLPKGFDKTTLVRDVLIKTMELNKVESLNYIFKHKFNDEHINVSDEEKEQIINDWISQLPILIKVMGSYLNKDINKPTFISIDDYINDYLLYVER